ncbi:hypothetical protein V1519DRAFT_467919 [Lipomyces tetrasporus]
MSTGVSSAPTTSNSSGPIDRVDGSPVFTAGIATAIARQDTGLTQDVSELIHDIWQQESLKEEQSLRQAALASLAAKAAVKTKVTTAVSVPTAIATTTTATTATVPAAPISPTTTTGISTTTSTVTTATSGESTATLTLTSSPTLPSTTSTLKSLHSSEILASEPATNLSQAMTGKTKKRSKKSSSAIKPPPNSITLTPAVDIPKPSKRGIIDLRKPSGSPELLPHNSSVKAIIDSEVTAAPVDGAESFQKRPVLEENNNSEQGQHTVMTCSPTKTEDLENVAASNSSSPSASARGDAQFSAVPQSTALTTTPFTSSTATISPTDESALVVSPPSNSSASAPDVVSLMADAPYGPSLASPPPLGAVGHTREKSSIDIAASALKYALSKLDTVIPVDPPAADTDSLIPWLLRSALYAQTSLIRMLTEERDQLRLQVRDSKEHADRLVTEISRLESQIRSMVSKLVERERIRAEKEFLQQLQMDTQDASTCSSSTFTPPPTFLPLSAALSSAPSQAAQASSQASRAPPRAQRAQRPLQQALPALPASLQVPSQKPIQVQPLLPDAVSVKAMPNTTAAIASAVLPQDPSRLSLPPVPESPVVEQASKPLPVSALFPASASVPAPSSPPATSPNGTGHTGLTSLVPKSSARPPTHVTETHPTAPVDISSPTPPAEPSSGPPPKQAASQRPAPQQSAAKQPTSQGAATKQQASKQQAAKQPASQQPTSKQPAPKQATIPPRRIQRSPSPRPARTLSTVPDTERRRQREPDDVSAHEKKRQKTGPQQRTEKSLGRRSIDSYRPNDDLIHGRERTGINKPDSQYQLSADVQRDDINDLAGRIGGHLQKELSLNHNNYNDDDGTNAAGLGDRLGSRFNSVGGLGNRIGGGRSYASSWHNSQSSGLSNRFGGDATPSSDRRGNKLGYRGDTSDFGNRIDEGTR